MRKFLFAVLVAVAAVGANGSFAGAAGPPAIATGTWACTGGSFSLESIRTAGGNTIFSFTLTGCVYAGDLTGTFSTYGTQILRRDGSFTFHGGLTCTGCTIGGRTGDFTAAQTFHGKSEDDAEGTITVLSATGGLTGLRAQSHFEFTGPSVGTYSYRYAFRP